MGEGNKRSDRRVNGERQLRRRRREEGERKGDKYRGKDMYEYRQTPHLSCHYTGSNRGIIINNHEPPVNQLNFEVPDFTVFLF